VARIDYEAVGADFERGRGLPQPAVDAWMDVIARHFEHGRGGVVLDLGSGTGIFADAMAERFGVRVVGLEPAAAMRAEAARTHGHDLVSYAGGDAMHIPLRDASCEVAWLSTIIHHVPDLSACAREVRRAVRDGGVALVRSSFPGRHEQITLFRRFPGASRVAATFPTVEETVAAFTGAGWTYEGLRSVAQMSARGLRVFTERVRLRADTTLRLMDDEEYRAGLAELEREAAEERVPKPIFDRIDLLTFRN
jgi:SAM-dependent methyltransferase